MTPELVGQPITPQTAVGMMGQLQRVFKEELDMELGACMGIIVVLEAVEGFIV